MTDDLTLTVSRTIPAPPKAVYDAWLSPDTLRRFMFPNPPMTLGPITTDPRPGGLFSIDMDGEPHHGKYLELIPHSRIVFTWNSKHVAEDSVVTLTLTPAGSGTEVELHHLRFPSERSRDGHRGGWTKILTALEGIF